jgi:hypothetical protein
LDRSVEIQNWFPTAECIFLSCGPFQDSAWIILGMCSCNGHANTLTVIFDTDDLRRFSTDQPSLQLSRSTNLRDPVQSPLFPLLVIAPAPDMPDSTVTEASDLHSLQSIHSGQSTNLRKF